MSVIQEVVAMVLAHARDREALRVWPGVIAVTLQWLLRFGVPMVAPDATAFGMIGGIVGGGLAVLIWWLFFSRAPWLERCGAILLMIAGGTATWPILHASVATGMMGMMFGISVIPGVCLALVVWAVASRWLTAGPRRLALVAAILAACGFWAVLRTDGVTGEGNSQLAWRWAKTPEQKLIAGSQAEPAAPPAGPATETHAIPHKPLSHTARVTPDVPVIAPSRSSGRPAPAQTGPDWTGFRGPDRDDRVTGVRIDTDWASSPPVELWRRPVGPGWSSFAVGDGLIYTQEQRGEFEVAACYKLATGEPVWTHRDAARFWESNGGAGPRGTPALHGGRVYTFGATGIVNALDAHNGRVIWTRNAASDTGAKIPEWGFASSPLVVDDLVVVAVSGRLAAYDVETGDRRWLMWDGSGSYGSPQLLTIDGVAQVVLLTGAGGAGYAPADGKLLWKHSWPGFAMLQPALAGDGGVLVTTGSMAGGSGTRRLAVARGPGGWTADEVWTSTGLKPYFNDIVVHKGNAYGFDGGILACIDLRNGSRTWKGGRYGHGQTLLLADQDLLLVLSEEGEVALVAAIPGQFTEIARFAAVQGKTWNHPVLAGDTLLIRNGQEMVAFRCKELAAATLM